MKDAKAKIMNSFSNFTDIALVTERSSLQSFHFVLCLFRFSIPCRRTRVLSTARASPSFATSDEPTVRFPFVEQVGAIGMTVSDMDASVDFYSQSSVV